MVESRDDAAGVEVRDGTFQVPEGIKRRPLDGVLRGLAGGAPWKPVRRAIETGKVRVNGAVVTDVLHPVSSGDAVVVDMRARKPSTEQRLSSEVLVFCDPHIAVVKKPPGVSTVPFEEGERGTLDQLVRALLTRERKSRGGVPQATLGVVHRLDRETSGLIVFARTLTAKKELSAQFRVHSVHRIYVALVHGRARAQTIRSRLVANKGNGLRGSTTDPTQGVPAITHVTVLEHFKRASLVACQLETGRTHQIRIHLSEMGTPIVGDRVYTRYYKGELLPAARVMLHARELGFVHPVTQKELRFEEPIPEDMERVIAELRRE